MDSVRVGMATFGVSACESTALVMRATTANHALIKTPMSVVTMAHHYSDA